MILNWTIFWHSGIFKGGISFKIIYDYTVICISFYQVDFVIVNSFLKIRGCFTNVFFII